MDELRQLEVHAYINGEGRWMAVLRGGEPPYLDELIVGYGQTEAEARDAAVRTIEALYTREVGTRVQQQVATLAWVLKRAEQIVSFDHGKEAATAFDRAWAELPPAPVDEVRRALTEAWWTYDSERSATSMMQLIRAAGELVKGSQP